LAVFEDEVRRDLQAHVRGLLAPYEYPKEIEFIDQWRQQVGVVFDSEKPAALKLPVDRRPLKYAACAEHAMRYGQVGENPKKVSRLVLGTMAHLLPNQAQANVLLDHFFSCGGSALDTAHVYGTEEIVGRWLATRKARSEIFLIGKGAAFEITPENVLVELNQSLARLNTDHLDLYMMHRDNEKVPVGEFVDVLAGLQKKGVIKAYGGSNWSKERIAAAEKYAVKNGLPPIGGSSPNFCLARWNQPMWSGCISACDPASREFYRKTQLPLFAWSATASGFLAGRFQPSDAKKLGPEDPAVATWFNPDNFRRLRNLERLSAKLQVPPAALALAYIFHQGLNAFALIGPQTIHEMNDSLSSLSVEWTNEINEQLEKIESMSAESIVQSLRAMRERESSITFLQKAEFPIHYFAGANDKVLSLEKMKTEWILLPSAKITIVPEIGHMGHIENIPTAKKFIEEVLSEFVS
jgi:aryl-alcohol dehydrogenase-like predicted oxidoreductase